MSPPQRVAFLQALFQEFQERNVLAIKEGQTCDLTLKIAYTRGGIAKAEIFDHEVKQLPIARDE